MESLIVNNIIIVKYKIVKENFKYYLKRNRVEKNCGGIYLEIRNILINYI